MRHIRIGLVLVALGGCEKTLDTPEVQIISADASAASATDTSTAADVPAEASTLAAATREKLLTLAVASECLRKANTPPEESANKMLALYKEHEVDLGTYTREMTRLAGDPAFQAAIDARVGNCPAIVATADVVVGDTNDGVASDTGPDIVDTLVADTLVVPETIAAADTLVAPETAIADTQVVDTTIAETQALDTTIADTRVLPEVSIDPVPEVAFTGTWTGQLYGGSTPGNLRIAINGRTITSAVATFGKSTIRLKGSISEKGSLSLGGTADQDYIRISGTAQSSGRGINGTWDGVVEKKRGNGRFLLKR